MAITVADAKFMTTDAASGWVLDELDYLLVRIYKKPFIIKIDGGKS